LQDPIRIEVSRSGTAAKGITHRLFLVEPQDKTRALVAMLNTEPGSTLIFVKMKRDADKLAVLLEKHGHHAGRMHSNLSQSQRVRELENFRRGKTPILVATDIAARGIDVEGIAHIINFNLPNTAEDYVHRAGRTARAQREGISSTIGTFMDASEIRSIEKLIGFQLPRHTLEGVPAYTESKAVRTMGRPPRPRLGGNKSRFGDGRSARWGR
jgi:ATP-dependent RNA helicase RhlE